MRERRERRLLSLPLMGLAYHNPIERRGKPPFEDKRECQKKYNEHDDKEPFHLSAPAHCAVSVIVVLWMLDCVVIEPFAFEVLPWCCD
jgi:hypothetical protein